MRLSCHLAHDSFDSVLVELPCDLPRCLDFEVTLEDSLNNWSSIFIHNKPFVVSIISEGYATSNPCALLASRNLNYYLYKAPGPCIEYVILHELAHFLYPHHDQNFHDFITIYMPDWQERKRLLDYEIVLGI